MRLGPYEIKAIQSVIYNMDPKATIYLFVSRTDEPAHCLVIDNDYLELKKG